MSRKEDMKIAFSGLKPGRYSYRFVLDDVFFEECENEELQGGNVEIAAEMERSETMLLFGFRLKGEVDTWCDRCLGRMTVPVEGEERLCVRFGDGEGSGNEEEALLPEGAGEIDLSQWFYEYVAVRMPMRHVHDEGGCDPEAEARILDEEEIAERRRTGTDPRWDALKDLK